MKITNCSEFQILTQIRSSISTFHWANLLVSFLCYYCIYDKSTDAVKSSFHIGKTLLVKIFKIIIILISELRNVSKFDSLKKKTIFLLSF